MSRLPLFASSPIFPPTSQTPRTLPEHDEHLGPYERSHCDDLRQSSGFTPTVTPTRTKMTRAPCRRRTGEAVPRAEKFGDLITTDHKVLNEDGESRNNHRARCRCSRSCYSMDSILSVQNKNFSGDGQDSKKVSRAVREAESHSHWHFIGIWQIPCRFFMESVIFDTSSIRDTWHCWKSRKPSERRNFSSIATIRIGWKMVVWFYGMLLLFAICPRPPGRLENSLRKAIRRTIWRPNNFIWSNGWISPDFTTRPVKASQFGKKDLPGMFFGCALIEGWLWKGDILVADIEELEKMDASENHPRIITAEEVLTTLWRSYSRPGCQSPQRKYAGYLSTTLRKVKVSVRRNSKVIKEMMRKEMKWREKSKRSEATLTTCMDDYGMNGDSNLSLRVRASKQGRQSRDNDTNWQQKERLRKRRMFSAWWLMHCHQLRSQISQVFQVTSHIVGIFTLHFVSTIQLL